MWSSSFFKLVCLYNDQSRINEPKISGLFKVLAGSESIYSQDMYIVNVLIPRNYLHSNYIFITYLVQEIWFPPTNTNLAIVIEPEHDYWRHHFVCVEIVYQRVNHNHDERPPRGKLLGHRLSGGSRICRKVKLKIESHGHKLRIVISQNFKLV